MVKYIQQLHEVIQNKIVKLKHDLSNSLMSSARIQYRPIKAEQSALFNKKNTNHIRYDGKALSKNKHGKLLCEAVTILLFPFPFNFFSFPLPWS